MRCDRPGPVVDIAIGVFDFRGLGVSVAARGALSFPQSTMPDKRSEKDQQDADDDTSDDPSDSASTQSVKRASGQVLNTTGRIASSYVEGSGSSIGSPRVLQTKHDPISSSEIVESNGRVRNARWGTMSDSIVNAKGLTTKRGVYHPNLVVSRTKSSTPVQ